MFRSGFAAGGGGGLAAAEGRRWWRRCGHDERAAPRPERLAGCRIKVDRRTDRRRKPRRTSATEWGSRRCPSAADLLDRAEQRSESASRASLGGLGAAEPGAEPGSAWERGSSSATRSGRVKPREHPCLGAKPGSAQGLPGLERPARERAVLPSPARVTLPGDPCLSRVRINFQPGFGAKLTSGSSVSPGDSFAQGSRRSSCSGPSPGARAGVRSGPGRSSRRFGGGVPSLPGRGSVANTLRPNCADDLRAQP